MFIPGSAASRASSNQKQPLLSVWVGSSTPGWNLVKCLIASSHRFETPSSLDTEYLSTWCEPINSLGKKISPTLGWCLGGEERKIRWLNFSNWIKQLCLHPVDTPIMPGPSCPKSGLSQRIVWKLYGGSVIAASDISALCCCPGWWGSSRF